MQTLWRTLLLTLIVVLPALALLQEWVPSEGRWAHPEGFSLALPEGFLAKPIENRLQARRGTSYFQFMPVSERAAAEKTVNDIVDSLNKKQSFEFSPLKNLEKGPITVSFRVANAVLENAPMETAAGFVTLQGQVLLFYSILPADAGGAREFVQVLESVRYAPTKPSSPS